MRYVKLYYFSEVEKFDITVFVHGFDINLYYCTISIPEVEFINKDFGSIGEDMLRFTATADWLATGKREIRHGDVLYYKGLYYGYLLNVPDTLTQLKINNIFKDNIRSLPTFSKFSMVRLRKPELQPQKI